MKRKFRMLIVATVPCWILAGCAPAVLAPSTLATPGPGKTPADLAADHAACSADANQQIVPLKMSANNQVVNTMLTSDLATAAATAQAANASLQQQLDLAYSGCMYARGEMVAGYAAAVPDEPVYSAPRRRRAAPKPAGGSAAFAEPAPVAASTSSGFTEPPPAR